MLSEEKDRAFRGENRARKKRETEMPGHGNLRGFTGVYTRRRWRPKAGGGGAEAMRPTRDAVNERASGRAGEHLLDVEDAEAAAASGDAGNGGGRVHGGGGEIQRSSAGSGAKQWRGPAWELHEGSGNCCYLKKGGREIFREGTGKGEGREGNRGGTRLSC